MRKNVNISGRQIVQTIQINFHSSNSLFRAQVSIIKFCMSNQNFHDTKYDVMKAYY